VSVFSKLVSGSPKKELGSKFLILLSLWLICFLPIYPGLVKVWLNHSDNSHGILVPLISLYFVWRKRENLTAAKISGSNWGIVILIISLGLYLLSYAGGIVVISRSMIVFSLMGLVLFILGKEFFKSLVFPLFFLLFMVPIPDSILGIGALPLQLFATKVSSSLLRCFSIPHYREGNMLYIGQTHLEIAEACSGIRPLISYVMVSTLFTYFLGDPIRKVAFLVSAVPLSLFANIIRVTGIGMLAHFYGSKVALGFLHDFSGGVVFMFGFTLLFLEFQLLKRNGK